MDLDDAPRYACSFDRMGLDRNSLAYKPVSEICDGDASDPGSFDPACTYMPWTVHFEPGMGTDPADNTVFPIWDTQNKYNNACPIVENGFLCGNEDLASYQPSSTYGNDDENIWASSRGLGFGEDSRCFESSLFKPVVPGETFWDATGGRRNGHCYKRECTDTELIVILTDASGAETRLTCPVGGGKIYATGYSGMLLCPSFEDTCAYDAGAVDFRTSLQDPSALRFKGSLPAQGASAGGTNVRIFGRGFADGMSVSFGGSPAASVTIVSDAELVATTPAGTDGPADILLESGDSSDTGFQSFVYRDGATVNPQDEARVLTTDGFTGGTAELKSGNTWNQVFFKTPDDAGLPETIYY
eukprot:COSAG06_NODE_4721_length_4007_cov_8.144831_2_plen_357_part_00